MNCKPSQAQQRAGENKVNEVFIAEQVDDVDGTDMANVSTESLGNCRLMHTRKGFSKTVQPLGCISTFLNESSFFAIMKI